MHLRPALGTIALLTVIFVNGSYGISHAAPGPPYGTPEDSVHAHIAAAKAGDVAALRANACGKLATAIAAHNDDEVRQEFIDAYRSGPTEIKASPATTPGRVSVSGFYAPTDLDIAFSTEVSDGWKVCEIRRGNGIFGALPGPFES